MIRRILGAGALVVLTGCGGNDSGGGAARTAHVTGTVTYLQSTPLPPDAEVHAVLQDISVPGAPARTIAATSIVTDGQQVPIPFSIAYDPAEVDESRTYSVHAEIHIGGQTRFITTQAYPVITREAPSKVDVTVMALAPPPPAPALVGTYWKLVSVAGKGVIPVQDARREPHLTLLPEENRAIATGGCNQMTGTYTMMESGVTFSPFMSTKMACPDVMDQERALGEALAATRGYRIDGMTLELTDAKHAVLARFEAAQHEE
ncbi:MAG: YbaY family lipoprotein [Candidatus Krumholzibacteria bacterium]|nr:YbaY family lipoprotein [Candidatus Krumholzibacteria bacterium]MDH4336853.1 YbaY family lipoprotein [Candidatus Krumholzibacteria bacterium]MDH5269184.1 YbaY family lipoprotein [Candidatus Krumholzibacteria bacterium]